MRPCAHILRPRPALGRQHGVTEACAAILAHGHGQGRRAANNADMQVLSPVCAAAQWTTFSSVWMFGPGPASPSSHVCVQSRNIDGCWTPALMSWLMTTSTLLTAARGLRVQLFGVLGAHVTSMCCCHRAQHGMGAGHPERARLMSPDVPHVPGLV
jgi:hypothetical protein